MNGVYLADDCQNIENCQARLQALIDRAANEGGGQVRLTAGVYTTSTIYLKSGVELFLDAGAVLKGYGDWQSYSNQCPKAAPVPGVSMWYDSIITAVGQKNIAVRGEGIVDGVDLINPNGEQGFRGPHALFFYDCEDIAIEGITVVRSACYSLMFEKCEGARILDVKIRGGQDGLRLGSCRDVELSHCDIRSGDDCIGGSGNSNVRILDTALNTPGDSAILFSCVGFTLKRSVIWSSCAYPAVFKDDKRYSLCRNAIVAGYDYGYDWDAPSDDWRIEDVTLENVKGAFRFERELYNVDHAIPIRNITMRRVTAVNLVEPIIIRGADDRLTRLSISDCQFLFAKDDPECEGAFIKADHFDLIDMDDVLLTGVSETPIQLQDGNTASIKNLRVERALSNDDVKASGIPRMSISARETQTTAPRFVTGDVTSIYLPKDEGEVFRGRAVYYKPGAGIMWARCRGAGY